MAIERTKFCEVQERERDRETDRASERARERERARILLKTLFWSPPSLCAHPKDLSKVQKLYKRRRVIEGGSGFLWL